MGYYVFGIDGLDAYLSGVLRPNSLVVFSGYPGSGKTTLASTVCFSNALRGSRCLYLSFFEDRDKLFDNMFRLGLDLRKVESEGLLRFVKLPIIRSVSELSGLLSNLVSEFRPDLIVLDSVNALLSSIPDADRAVLHNTIYELPRLINGLVVVIAELYGGNDDLRSIYYVADVVLVLSYRSEGGLVSRVLEVKKVRGGAVTISELPFTILGNVGLKVLVPPILEDLGMEGRELDLVCSGLRKVLDHIHLGWSVYVSYSPYFRPISLPLLATGLHVGNGLRGLVISYIYSGEVVERNFLRALRHYGVRGDIARDVVRKHFIFKSFNPYSYSVGELALRELSLIERHKPDTVIFQGVEVLSGVYPDRDYLRQLYNQINYLKHKGLLVIRSGGYINPQIHKWNTSLADVHIGYRIRRNDDKVTPEVLIWRRNTPTPHILNQEDIDNCCKEMASIIQSKCVNTDLKT